MVYIINRTRTINMQKVVSIMHEHKRCTCIAVIQPTTVHYTNISLSMGLRGLMVYLMDLTQRRYALVGSQLNSYGHLHYNALLKRTPIVHILYCIRF